MPCLLYCIIATYALESIEHCSPCLRSQMIIPNAIIINFVTSTTLYSLFLLRLLWLHYKYSRHYSCEKCIMHLMHETFMSATLSRNIHNWTYNEKLKKYGIEWQYSFLPLRQLFDFLIALFFTWNLLQKEHYINIQKSCDCSKCACVCEVIWGIKLRVLMWVKRFVLLTQRTIHNALSFI